ncbi:MAG TPA: phosphate ABC transporter permease subunit PstC, partial [Thermoleophilaceae bacterium]|nr:phosphate ABC transporter permease subunit PstC [Thermoleophilaceae bacterium]
SAHPAAASATPRTPVLGVAKRRRGEDAIRIALFLAALLSILTTLGIIFSLLSETIRFLGDVAVFDFLLGTEWSPLFADPSFGVLPLVTGTLLVTALALIVAIPLGLGTAIYLAEYANPTVRKVVKPFIELLAGVPTIVFGYFALTFFTPVILNDLLGMDVPTFNALSAGIIMGFMVLPTVASISEDAMSAVPRALREGAFGLGANKLQVSLFVVFPAALSGIVAAIVLGVSRAIGETMIVLVAAGQQPNFTADPRESVETITTFIAATAKGDIATGSTAYKTIFAVGMVLFLMTLLMNAIAIRFVRRYRQVYE